MQWERVKKNANKVALLATIYIVLHTVLFLIYEFITLKLELSVSNFPNDFLFSIVDISKEIILCGILGALQAIIFSRLGVILDSSVWRCRDDREALRRFFLLWFGINVALITLNRVSTIFADKGYSDLVYLIEGLSLFANIVYLPLTACWMYSGEKLTEDDSFFRVFRPITRQFSETVRMWVIIIISILISIFILELPIFEEPSVLTAILKTLIIIPLAGIDILVFCWTWLLCIQGRIQGLDDDYSLDDF
ncbi:MAG TPA: hypothetical protein PLX23_06090 [Candidatus Hydrogenedens sp.]|nr:hypothetical protein [Candidatus Hydrogenedens sp.]